VSDFDFTIITALQQHRQKIATETKEYYGFMAYQTFNFFYFYMKFNEFNVKFVRQSLFNVMCKFYSLYGKSKFVLEYYTK
jgi:hypothetical protein